MSAPKPSSVRHADDATPSIDVDQYIGLPYDLRRELDHWLAEEELIGERLTWFRLLEGAIEAERWATDASGNLIVRGDELVRERRIYPIATAPPKAALS